MFRFASANSTTISPKILNYEFIFQRSLLGLKYIVEETHEDWLDRHYMGILKTVEGFSIVCGWLGIRLHSLFK